MDLLDAAQVEMLIQSADKKREKYVNSEKYVPEMCSVLLQNWNMIGNYIFFKTKPSTSPTLEFMTVYQQILNVYPDEFEGRDINKIKESIQKSIYGSIHTKLFKNYINELENNHKDSFLVVPVSMFYKEKWYSWFKNGHGVTFIIKKEQDRLNVEVYDKAQMRMHCPDKRALKKKIQEKLRFDLETLKITPVYVYEGVEKKGLEEVLRIGRQHLTFEERINPFATAKRTYHILNKLSNCTEKEYVANHIATTQYVQGNCEINNMNASLKYILGTRKQVTIHDRNFWQTKYKTLSTEKFNYVMNELMIMHLEKSGYGKEEVRNFISKAYDHYLDRKKEREQLPLENKKIHKVFWGDKYNNAIWTIPFVPRKEVVPESRHITGAEIKAIRNRCDQFDQKKVETLRKIIIDSNSKKNQRTQRDSQRQLNVSNGIK